MESSVFKDLEQKSVLSRLAATPKKVEKEQPKQPQIVASHPPSDIHERMSKHIRITSESSATSPIIADLNCRIAANVDSTKANYELQRKFSRFVASLI